MKSYKSFNQMNFGENWLENGIFFVKLSFLDILKNFWKRDGKFEISEANIFRIKY